MQKNWTLFVGAFILSISLMAQPASDPVAKGNKQAGIQIMISPTDTYYSETALSISKTNKIYGLHVAGDYGWFIERGWLIGVQLNAGFIHETYNKDEPFGYKTDAFDIGIAPMTRYYFSIDRKHRFKPFLMAGLPITYTQTDRFYFRQSGNDFKEETVTAKGTFGLGAAYFGNAGSIEMNLSNLGLFLGFHKFLTK